MARTARMPTIATTIISSISVKPRFAFFINVLIVDSFSSALPCTRCPASLPLGIDEHLVREGRTVDVAKDAVSVVVGPRADDVPVGRRRGGEDERLPVDGD